MEDPFCYLNYNIMTCENYNAKLIVDESNLINFFYEEIIKFFISLSIILFGFAASFIFVGIFIVNPLIKKDFPLIEMYHNLEKEAKIEIEFLETNYDKFKDLSMNDLSEKYNNEYFEMETPRGIVYMCYDRELNTFNFYCNKKEIPNYYLDCVARNFVIKYDCKSIYIDLNEEMKKVYQLKNKRNESKSKEKKIKNSNVFAKFKNTVSNEQSQKDLPLIPEKCNIYKYKGKVIDYENVILKLYDKESDKDYIKIDYKSFKNKIE